MFTFLKRNLFLIFIFFSTLLLGFITFLTFIDKSFIDATDQNLRYLLIFDILLLLFFFGIIFLETKNSLKQNIVDQVLYFSQNFIISYFPMSEFYLNYFFESVKNIFEIWKNLITVY